MKKFEVRFLSKKEMTNAKDLDPRYEGVDDDNLGFADPKTNRIFVLASEDTEFMKYLVNHELEHLLEEKGTHEDDAGIRHKKGGFFKNLLPFISPIPVSGGNAASDLLNPAGSFTSPLSPTNMLNSAMNPLSMFGGGQQKQQQGGIDFESLFQPSSFGNTNQMNIQSLGQGYQQQGSFSPAGQGYGGSGSGTGLNNIGLGQAGISLGSQGSERPQSQNQSGYFFPSYTF